MATKKAHPQKKQAARMPKKKRTKDGGAVVSITPVAAAVVFDGEPLDDWDDDELIRGKRKDKNGKFTGRPAQVIPARLHRELTRRRFSRSRDLMAESLEDCARMLRSIVVDEAAPIRSRIHAAEVLMDRVLGRPKESMAIDFANTAEPAPWQRMMAEAIVGNLQQAIDAEAESIIEGEVVEEPSEASGGS
jgi:hypothetical protein